jgi:hypothetical protein
MWAVVSDGFRPDKCGDNQMAYVTTTSFPFMIHHSSRQSALLFKLLTPLLGKA